jgi:hypothetical protein
VKISVEATLSSPEENEMNEVITRERGKAGAKEKSMSTSQAAVGKPWKIEVDVYLQAPGSNTPFYLETCLPVDANNNIVFYNAERQGFEISFILHDELNPGYKFPNPPGPPGQNDPSKWALWSRQGPGCPPPGYQGLWSEFSPQSVQQNGKVLVVKNDNSFQTLFGYTLRVTKDGGNTFLDLDPGGNNMNGGTPFR